MRVKNIKPGDECPMVAVIWAILRGRGQMAHGPVGMKYEGDIVEAIRSFQVTSVAHNFEDLVADGEIGERTIGHKVPFPWLNLTIPALWYMARSANF